jgi:hypothetical protein
LEPREDEDLSLDQPGTESDDSHRILSLSIPKGISYLRIEASTFIADSEGSHLDPWEEDWQIDDLNQFLQDKSFERLSLIELALGADSSEYHIDTETTAVHGWQATMGKKSKLYCELENKGRGGVTGPRSMEDEWGVINDAHEAYHSY